MVPTRHAPHRVRGISLVEAMLAALVLSVGLLALAKFQADISTSGGQSKSRSEALNIAQQKLDELKNFADTTAYNAIAGSAANESISGSSESFTRSWTVVESADPAYKQVTVNVAWSNKEGQQGLSLTSFIARTDPAEAGGLLVATAAPVGVEPNPAPEPESDETTPDSTPNSGNPDVTGEGTSQAEQNPDELIPASAPEACQCFYKNSSHGASLIDSDSNGSCCSDSYCDDNVPAGQSNNSNFTLSCS